MSSAELAYTSTDRQTLLQVAREAVARGLAGERLSPDLGRYPEALRQQRASFVTLTFEGNLRGCIGTLEARTALVADVADNAHGAAFRDPRFPGLTQGEYDALEYHISVLGVPERMQFESESDLLGQLRPAVDGLILEAGYHRGTFLPSVWEQLPEPRDFLSHLKRKAGLPADYWSEDMRIHRYTAYSIE